MAASLIAVSASVLAHAGHVARTSVEVEGGGTLEAMSIGTAGSSSGHKHTPGGLVPTAAQFGAWAKELDAGRKVWGHGVCLHRIDDYHCQLPRE